MLLTLLLFEYYVLYIVFISVLVSEEQENYGRDVMDPRSTPTDLRGSPTMCIYGVIFSSV